MCGLTVSSTWREQRIQCVQELVRADVQVYGGSTWPVQFLQRDPELVRTDVRVDGELDVASTVSPVRAGAG
eukprot:NODE_7263_length_1595_cov_3.021798.p2 GENE.NODE_7263_length_1595_cov_3.021798~~NODE_7263_length_1595_cov_3.021798.p2  ORF type:complete len:71 (+),score=12.73 NODE_7263_length_1595_cov_3.021798:304-516(+)